MHTRRTCKHSPAPDHAGGYGGGTQDGIAAGYLDEGLRLIDSIQRAAGIIQDPHNTAELMRDVGHNGQVNTQHFREIIEELAASSSAALV